MQHPKSYKAAKNVELTIMGSNPEDTLGLMGHVELGKEACSPIETSFDPVGAHIGMMEDFPVIEPM